MIAQLTQAAVSLRSAATVDAASILSLVAAHREEGHLLARTLDDITAGAHRFVVAERDGRLLGCAELRPLAPSLVEVRSLVVHPEARGTGLGRQLVAELERRARTARYEQLCAFTHEPGWFCRLGFSLVPHAWLAPKIFADCGACPLFRSCGQSAMVIELRPPLRPWAVQ